MNPKPEYSHRRSEDVPFSKPHVFFFQDGVKVGASGPGEGVLANFFNSLLSKKSNTQGGVDRTRLGPGDKATARQDAAAELEKMTRAKKLASVDGNQLPGADSS